MNDYFGLTVMNAMCKLWSYVEIFFPRKEEGYNPVYFRLDF